MTEEIFVFVFILVVLFALFVFGTLRSMKIAREKYEYELRNNLSGVTIVFIALLWNAANYMPPDPALFFSILSVIVQIGLMVYLSKQTNWKLGIVYAICASGFVSIACYIGLGMIVGFPF